MVKPPGYIVNLMDLLALSFLADTDKTMMKGIKMSSEEFQGKEPESRDPWQHRSRDMSCATCMWYVPKKSASGQNARIGRCRRHAPTMNGYPAVFNTDWCGDHKVDEAFFQAIHSGAAKPWLP